MISQEDIMLLENIIKNKSNISRNLSEQDIKNNILYEKSNLNIQIKKYRQQEEYGAKKFIKP